MAGELVGVASAGLEPFSYAIDLSFNRNRARPRDAGNNKGAAGVCSRRCPKLPRPARQAGGERRTARWLMSTTS